MKFLIPTLIASIVFVSIYSRADSVPGENSNTKQCQNVLVRVCKNETVVVVKKKAKKKKVIYLNDIPIEKTVTKTVTKVEKVDSTKRNIVSIFGQSRITDLKTATTPTSAKVESVREPVLGLMYQRITDSGLVLGAGLDTEGDGLLNIGIGW